MKIQKKKLGGGVRGGGGGRVGGWGQGRCERRIIVFVKIQKKTRIDVYETLCPQQMLVHKGGKIKNWGVECRDVTPTILQSQNIFKERTGGGRVGGVIFILDVNEELKFLRK